MVAEPEVSNPAGIRTARVVEVPGEGALDGVEIVLDPAPASSYDVVPLQTRVNDRDAVSEDLPEISYDGTVVAVRASTETCDCAGRQSGRPSARATDPAGDFAGIVLHDRITGEDEPLLAPNGAVIDPDWTIALDDDGSTVAFVSGQDGLVEGDDDGSADVFVLDRVTSTLTRLEHPEDGIFEGRHLTLSGDGSRLAVSVLDRLAAGSYLYDVAVIDLDPSGAETSRRMLGAQTRAGVDHDLSRDGSTVAWTQFHSTSPGSGDWNLHVLDLASGEEDPLRPFSEGIDSWNGTAGPPSLSDDGSLVAYGNNVLFETPGGYDQWLTQVELADRSAGTTRTVDPFGIGDDPEAAAIRDFQLSGNGTELLVTSGGVPEEDDPQAWVVDLTDDDAEMVSRAATGAPAREGVEMIAAPSSFSVLAFSTESEDLSGTENDFVVLALGEGVPPEWPEDAAVIADAGDIGASSVRLHWTEATDNVAVTGYRVFRGDTLVGTTSASTRQLRVTGLAPDTSYTFTVQAVDGRAAVSTDGPSVTVRTLPDESTELRPLDLTARPGGVVDLAWEAAQGADELVLRTYLGDTQVDERTLPATATSAQEVGLAAATAYSFQVLTRTGGTVQPFTERATVTTGALTFGALTWTVPTLPDVRPEVARRGSTATITATAETGRAVSVAVEHLSWYDVQHHLLDDPRTVTSVVPLTEVGGSPGTYRGSFELVDGVARIVGMVGTVSDGQGGTLDRTSTRAPIRVSSSVVATVDAPAGSLPGGLLQLDSETTRQTRSEYLTGGAVFTYEHFKPASDLVVEVVDARARTLDVRKAVRVRDGLATALTLTPRLPATLAVSLEHPDGGSFSGTRVDVSDADTGAFIGTRSLQDGTAEFWDVLEDQRVRVDVRYPASMLLEPEDPRTITLAAGENPLEIAAVAVPRQRVSGVVRYANGTPAPDTTVVLDQTFRGEVVQQSVRTGADGRYELSGVRGSAELLARSGIMRASEEVDLASGPVVRALVLTGPLTYDARLRLFVRPAGAGSETGPVPLDWRSAVHYGLALTVDGVSQRVLTREPEPDGSTVVRVLGAAGQVLRFCIGGYEAKLQSTCVERVLTFADRSPVLEMHAGPGIDVTMNLVDAAGARVRGAETDLYEVLDHGRSYVSATYGSGGRETARVPRSGTYVVVSAKDDLSAERTFTINPEDHGIDLGDVVLRSRAQFTGADNAVTASRSELLPGGDVELRATWRNNGAALAGVVAQIAVPADTQLVPDSVILDGRPVAYTARPGYVDVELGTVAVNGTGSLRYRLRAGTATTGVAGRVDMRYPGSAGTVVEPLDPVTVPVAAVTLTGPTTVSAQRIPLSGRAPAGRVVTITDGGTFVGTALAGPGGYWSANVSLVEQPRTQSEHQLVAETTIDGQRFFAQHVVTLDDTRPAIQSVSIYQLDGEYANGRKITFDPLDGVARFPFVFVPGQPLRVEVKFDQPSLVARADVLIGEQRIPAVRRVDGVFVAGATLRQAGGPIRVDFDAIAKPIDMGEAEQSEREIRDGAPAPLSGFELTDVQQPDAQAGTRTGAFTMSLPSVQGGSVRSTLTVTRETYTPTAADIAMERATGSPAYGVTSTRSGSTLSFSMVVPLSALPGMAARAESEGTEMGRALATMLRNAIGPESVSAKAGTAGVAIGVARVGYQLAFNGVTTLDSLLSAIGAGDKYDNLSKVIDAAGGCSPGKASAYTDRARNIALAAAAGDIGGALFSVGSLVLGPATFGLGTVALGVLGWALDKAIGYAIDQATESLKNDIKNDDDCKDDEEDDDDLPDPVADPVWIYDPSGYVYEGARSVRVPGVTATLLTAPTADGPWSVWDAGWFGQTNPQTTDDAGRYGWDVPEGWWKVAFTKDGYQPASSRVLRVLPPHLDVDVSMVKEGFPHVTGSVLRDGRVEVTFDRLVRGATADRSLTVVDAGGAEVPGSWAALGGTTGDGDAALQRGLRFTPSGTLPAGSRVTLTVDGVADYSGRLMAAPYVATLTAPTPGGGGPGGPTPTVPAAPTSVTAEAGERNATLSWTAPADNGAELLDYVVTVLPSGRQVTIGAGETAAEIDGLTPGVSYTFTVTARNEIGTGPASAPSNAVVPTVVTPDTALTTAPTGYVVSRVARMAWAATGASYVCELDGVARACDGTGTELSALGSATHTFTVAARDADGDLDPTPATATWTVPRDDRALAGGSAWKRRRNAGSFQGTVTETSVRGATLTARVEDATALALVVARGVGHGKVAVYLGRDRVGTVDLAATPRQRPVVPLRAFDAPRTGTVRIVVVSRHAVVRVDGLAVATTG
ncbi:MAG: fibronectin type III domain-containing protein [Nocardioides sp.]